MGLTRTMRDALEGLPHNAQRDFKRDYSNRRKSLLFAYLAWLLLGWHYLYLRRVGLQFAFWLTFGGFLLWWLVDFFRIPGLVSQLNEDTARELLSQYRAIAG